MGHLKEKNMGYLEHAAYALSLASRMLVGALGLLIHALFPNALTKIGTVTLHELTEIMEEAKRGTSHILVRFNTKWKETSPHFKWRVLVDGHETLAKQVSIKVPCYTVMAYVGDEEKYHLMCQGTVVWTDNYATIV